MSRSIVGILLLRHCTVVLYCTELYEYALTANNFLLTWSLAHQTIATDY
jgi:hypothetical protein